MTQLLELGIFISTIPNALAVLSRSFSLKYLVYFFISGLMTNSMTRFLEVDTETSSTSDTVTVMNIIIMGTIFGRLQILRRLLGPF